ncbi:MAG TPA: FtsX-like permease family protein [Baekduia sp.]|nr:FtsX-like permease family protein [Baekduia sp.]
MLKIALRGLLARRLRLVLTLAAIVAGVMLVSGTYVFTDTINRSFDRIFSASYAGIDVAVTRPDRPESEFTDSPPLPAALVDRIRGVEGVEAVEGALFDEGTVLGKDGKRINEGGGAPNFITSVSTFEDFSAVEVPEGRLPQRPGEAAIDKATADREGFDVGDPIDVQGAGERETLRIVGVTKVAGVDNFGGATILATTLPEAQRLLGNPGYDEIDVAAEQGLTPEELAARLRPVIGRDGTVRTGDQEADEQTSQIQDDLSFLNTALLAFAGIALFVGGFSIFNTFSITVAQRTREFGLLRTMGASRAQVLRSVLAEGALLGLVGGAVGVGAGILVASGLRELMQAFGFDVPSQGTVVESRTIIVAIVVGLLVTVLASLAPALRATRVSPLAALREDAVIEHRRSRVAPILGGVLLSAGVALMVAGLFFASGETGTLSLLGGGAAAAFLGVALLSPRLVGPLSRMVGFVAGRGLTGRLARENSVRQPGRTAVTAAALMVGVALVAFASIFAGSTGDFIERNIQQSSRSQAVVQNTDGWSPFPHATTRAVAEIDGVAAVTALRFLDVVEPGDEDESTGVVGIDQRTAARTINLTWDRGDDRTWERLRGDTAILSKDEAEDRGVGVGDRITVRTTGDQLLRLEVVGIHDDESVFLGPILVSNDIVKARWGDDDDSTVFVAYRDGADPQPAIDRLLTERFPAAEVLSNDEWVDEQAGQVNQLLGLIYALLSLAVVVSLFGIVNTLYLSITERTRELGLLRAVGTTRKQVKRMIRGEAAIIALIGSVLGLGLGVLLALLVGQAIDGFTITIPVVSLLVVLVLGGLAGVLAAIWPARRAARMDVLQALAYE